jgi:gamma-glutamyltranspeptidase/glutathione hydrolase
MSTQFSIRIFIILLGVWNCAPFAWSAVTPQEVVVESPIVLPANVGQSRRNMVATVSPIATQAGLDAIRSGGNAIDAAVAAAVTLGVVDGYNSGIGGGCFILIHTADGKLYAIDGRETAPALAFRDFYRDQNGELQPADSVTGAKAVAVPGALMAYENAVARHGKKKFSELLEPAAMIAEKGFEITPQYHSRIAENGQKLKLFPATAALLLNDDGTPLAAGTLLLQPDLAATYRNIASGGTDWFYKGPFAQQVSAWMRENGGAITESDFANYETIDRAPVATLYRDHCIVGFPPPSSGGIHVAQILNIVEHFDLKSIAQRNKAEAIHIIAEAMKLAFADRAHWPGDPAYTKVPKGLVAKTYACEQASQIDTGFASEVTCHGCPPNPDDIFGDRHTTHIAAADDEGNWIAITTTINTHFGSKVIVPGTGVLLNNEMDDFAIAPGVPNAFDLIGADSNSVESGKRPLSSMSPTIVLKDGVPVMTLGAAGGPKIITQVATAIIQVVDFEKQPYEAVGATRFHHQWSPDRLRVERTMSEYLKAELNSFGHELTIADSNNVGVTQLIARDPETGIFTGVHDPRVPGAAQGTE